MVILTVSFLLIDLFERQTGRHREQVSSICWFSLQIAVKAVGSPGWSQEAGMLSHWVAWVAETHAFGPSFTGFPNTIVWS